jgi:AcrR family transcriptional regulator
VTLIPHSTHGTRRTADERRKDVIAAAIIEFATYGLHGASTETIALRAGISQPYVLRLFGTKKALFLAAVQEVGEQLMGLWKRALADIDPDLDPEEKLWAIGSYYREAVREVHGLRLLLQSWAAAEDPDIRAEAQRCLKDMHAWIVANVGAPPNAIQRWFAIGMMLTVASSIGAAELVDEEAWARTFIVIPVE